MKATTLARNKLREYQQGRVAFRSATEKDAYEIVMLGAKELRSRLPNERRVNVLMIALEQLERTGFKTAAGFVKKRLEQLCSPNNTALTIIFQPGEKDFSEWDLSADGCVIDSRPCQAFVWCGNHVMNFEKLKVGGKVIIFVHDTGKLTMNYRIKGLVYGPAAGDIKYPEHKPRYMVLHEGGKS